MIRRRRRFLVAAMALPVGCLAQASAATKRIGWLEPGVPASFPARRKAFEEVLRVAGFIVGTNLAIDYRYAAGKLEQMPSLGKELVALHPDCLVATGVDSIKAVRQATSSIPIVMGTIDADPVEEGLVASLARPGGNITGMVGVAWELAGKRLELLKEVAPSTKRVAVLFDPRTPAGHAHLKQAQVAAGTLRIELHPLGVKEPADLEPAFRAARSAGCDALFVIAVGMVNAHRPRIVSLATETRLPAVYSNVEFVEDGGLIGYAPNIVEQYRRVGTYVLKILNGTKPADLAIMQPTLFELAVNLKTARVIGVAVPKSLSSRADKVIE